MNKRKLASAVVVEVDYKDLTAELLTKTVEKNGCIVVKNVLGAEQQEWGLSSLCQIYRRIRNKQSNESLDFDLQQPDEFFDRTRKALIPPARGTGILNVDSVGSLRFSDQVRALPELRRIWALWHACDAADLVPSRDRVGIMAPNNPSHAPWPHVDADIFNARAVRAERTLQGFVVWQKGHTGSGFCVHPGSHEMFDEWAEDKTPPRKPSNFYPIVYPAMRLNQAEVIVNPPAGSVVLWLSETVHWNTFGGKCRASLGRVVSYICYTPQQQLSDSDKRFLEEAVLTQETMGHRVKDGNLLRTGGNRFHANVWAFAEQDIAVYASLSDVPLAVIPWAH